MKYNHYKNLNDNEFLLIKGKLNQIDSDIEKIYKIMLKKIIRNDDSDFLNLNFKIEEIQNDVGGVLSVIFEDKLATYSFTLIVLKYFDKRRVRYYKRLEYKKNVDINDLEVKYEEYLKEGLNLYQKWQINDLNEKILLT